MASDEAKVALLHASDLDPTPIAYQSSDNAVMFRSNSFRVRKVSEQPLPSVFPKVYHHAERDRELSVATTATSNGSTERSAPQRLDKWEFPGWGSFGHLSLEKQTPTDITVRTYDDPVSQSSGRPPSLSRKALSSIPPPPENPHLLGQFFATAICGNDITSSCLYVVGLCGAAAGVYAPLALLLVVIMLYFFRFVYGEVCSALPLNGGAYNGLLNTTSKATASVAACLTILSYVATGVVSAAEAIQYLQLAWSGAQYKLFTVLLLGFFAFLNLMGITESAAVASGIFVFHCGTLVMLLVACFIYFCNHGFHQLYENAHSPEQESFGLALFYGFAAASLGISGFETSANFIEEQKPGVFPKTLRNMWAAVALFNPALSFLSLAILPLKTIQNKRSVVLAIMGEKAVGHWLYMWISIDAFLVLSGAIITSFVGVTGLCQRLAGDRCLPAVMLTTNKWRGTSHIIIITFFLICTSMFLLLDGKVESLSGVYSISFLSVMALFALSNMMLKYKRDIMPRDIIASWRSTIFAFVLVIVALLGTVAYQPDDLHYFVIYFVCTSFIFFVTFFRIRVLKMLLHSARRLFRNSPSWRERTDRAIISLMHEINSQSVAFFTKTDSLSILTKAVLYIRENEHTHIIRIVHVCPVGEKPPPMLAEHVAYLDVAFPKITINVVIVEGKFDREAIDLISNTYNIPKNLCFIAAPGHKFAVALASLGGVRVITH